MNTRLATIGIVALVLLAAAGYWLAGPLQADFRTGGAQTAFASDNDVEFDITDEPGAWFKNTQGPIGGSQSLAVVNPGAEVKFSGRSNTVHTVTSLVSPAGAAGMPKRRAMAARCSGWVPVTIPPS